MCLGPMRPGPDSLGPGRATRRAVLAGAAALGVVGCADRPGSAPAATPAPRTAGPFAVRDAAVFDGERSRGRATVLVEDGQVRAVGADVRIPDGVEVVDGRGATVLPGLIDCHVHAFAPDRDAPRFGVTTEIDMFTFTELLGPYREQRAGRGPTPFSDLWSAGTLATVPGGHGTQYGPVPTLAPGADARQADAFVAERLGEGSDHVKIIVEDGGVYDAPVPTLGAEQVGHLVAAARRRGTASVAHVGGRRDAEVAIAAGPDGLAHVPGQPVPAELVARAAAQGMFVVATLSVYDALGCAGGGPGLAADPRIAPWLTDAQRTGLASAVGRRCRPAVLPAAIANLAALHAAGVPVLAGTDVAGPRLAHGASLHGELELLTRAGLTPSEALRAATSDPARRFGLGPRGRVAPGHRADLVLVEGDPTRDITTTRAISQVWRNGHPIDRRA